MNNRDQKALVSDWNTRAYRGGRCPVRDYASCCLCDHSALRDARAAGALDQAAHRKFKNRLYVPPSLPPPPQEPGETSALLASLLPEYLDPAALRMAPAPLHQLLAPHTTPASGAPPPPRAAVHFVADFSGEDRSAGRAAELAASLKVRSRTNREASVGISSGYIPR